MSGRTVYSAYADRSTQARALRDEVLDRMKRRLAEGEQERCAEVVREHFQRLQPTLFQEGIPASFAEHVIDKVGAKLVADRVLSNRCAMCGRQLSTAQAKRFSVGSECYERFVSGTHDVAAWEGDQGGK